MKRYLTTTGIMLLLSSGAYCDSLLASVQAYEPDPTTWVYNVSNGEPSTSNNYISSFYLQIDAPIQTVSTPANWSYDTDGLTYIFWYDPDSSTYAYDISPGQTLGDFVVTAQGAISTTQPLSIYSWDHQLLVPGASLDTLADSPTASGSTTTVPEPAPVALAVFAITLFGLCRKKTVDGNCTRVTGKRFRNRFSAAPRLE